MEYDYSPEEQAFREDYYNRCGFGNTLFTDLPFEMQPPKIRNELKAACAAFSDHSHDGLFLNKISVGNYIADHPDFYAQLKDAEGIKEYKLNKDYCLARNAYDDARETQVNGINSWIKHMLDKASDLDLDDLMDKASEKDKISVDVYSETIAELNGVLGQIPDQKEEVQQSLRDNSIHSVGEHFGLDMDTKQEAFNRLKNVFSSTQKAGYPPFMSQQMRNIYPDSKDYPKLDESYMVKSMKEHQMVSSVASTLNSDSPVAVYLNQYGEKVFESIKEDPTYSELISKYRDTYKKNDMSR